MTGRVARRGTSDKRLTKQPAPRQAARAASGRDYLLSVIDELSRGNLAVQVDVDRDPKDPLLQAVARMARSLNDVFTELTMGSVLVEKSSSTMNSTARALRDNASRIQQSMGSVLSSTEEMRQNMNSVSASAEELSANMQSIANAARQSNDNVDSIQRSIKELTVASRDIASNSAQASAISKEAMESVSAAFALVNELTSAAKEIDVVTGTISEISDQTKLLALNATIESARAGEMGKGFAVVAKEVKELASQTNTATKDIQSKIGIIHEVTGRSVEAMTTINRVMKSVNEAIASIAAASEEQSVTTNDIAQNVVDATERIKEMSNNVSEGATAVQDVSKSILGATTLVNAVAREISELGAAGGEIRSDAVISYAQALEVTSHGGDIMRRLRAVSLPERARAMAEGTPLELCRFSRDYDVLVERMNEDHRGIFDRINAMHARIKQKVEPAKLAPTFREFAEFTRAHFAREEENMERAGYADLPGHRKIHEKLLAQVDDLWKALESGKPVDLIETLGFFRDWLINHIMGVDKKYGPSMNAAGIR